MIKKRLRNKILKLRKLRYKDEIKIDIPNFLKIIKKNSFKLKNKKDIGGYFPINYEIDDLEILKELKKRNYQISFPSISKNNQMDFYKCSLSDPLLINHYGIPEPIKKFKIYPDILLIPLVAFDSRLYRIGYGGGYYDRYIEKLSRKKKIFTIGLAFSFQKINKIPENKYDKKLDLIITEKSILQ